MLILVGFLPNEVWRMIGLVLARGIDEDSEIIVWVRAVATAIMTGVVGKLVVFAPGALGAVPMWVRIGAVSLGMLAYFLRRAFGARGRDDGDRSHRPRDAVVRRVIADGLGFREPARTWSGWTCLPRWSGRALTIGDAEPQADECR